MMEIPFAAVYRPQKHPVLNWVSYRCRCRHYDRLLAHDDIRGVLAALRENQVVWYTADIDPGSAEAVARRDVRLQPDRPCEALDRFGEIPRLQAQVPAVEERLGIGGGSVVGHRSWGTQCRKR